MDSAAHEQLARHLARLKRCRLCPRMASTPVTGFASVSRVILVGQAPGSREPAAGRPFAWTAGRTLFNWLASATGLSEENVRRGIYFAAVCRCFPGKTPAGGDRVPDREEAANCRRWLDAEVRILKPALLVPVGKLAIEQFFEPAPLTERIGRMFTLKTGADQVDVIPLPHPSGASPWHRTEPGRTLLTRALEVISNHQAMIGVVEAARLA